MGSSCCKHESKTRGAVTTVSVIKRREEGVTSNDTAPARDEHQLRDDVIQPEINRTEVNSYDKPVTLPKMPTGVENDASKLPGTVNTTTNESDNSDDEISDGGGNTDNETDSSSSSDDVESLPVSGDEEEEEEEQPALMTKIEAYTSSDERIALACKGRFDFEIPENVKIVRIFTSSTFTDTSVERNTLMVKVYPRIKKFCQERGYEFQVVDMRWGVRDESTDDHLTSELCMRELHACQRLSTGPNFITFLGQKYGYRPFPPKIPAQEFQKLFDAVTNTDDRELLQRWFKEDKNAIPAEYLLQPITHILPDYRNYDNPELRKKASGEWWTAFERMQVVFRNAAAKALDKKSRLKYFMSVTEDEVRRGIITASSPEDHCFWFKRVITNLNDNTQSQRAGSYIDKPWGGDQGAIDNEAQTLLESLREQDLPNVLPSKNIRQYEVQWSPNGIDPDSSPDHAQYIDDLCKTFYDTLTGMIDRAIGQRREVEIRDNLIEEITGHLSFCLKKCQSFHGREEFLEEMKKILKENHTLVIHGESGCGKTSIMAKACTLVRSWIDEEDCIVVTRFIGTSPDSSSIRPLLRSICTQLCRVCEEDTNVVPQDMKALIEYFPECLENAASSSRPVVIVLDSLDQLSPDDGARQMGWLPKELPDDVYLVMSTLPGDEYECFPRIKALTSIPSYCIKSVPQIPLREADVILKSWLQSTSRTLTQGQSQLVLDAFDKCQIPLYLKLAFDEACRWKSYSDSSQTVLASSVKSIINALFDRVERVHGKLLVGHALGYITASKNGLTEAELEDLLSLDDEVLNDVYQYWTPPLRRLPPLLWIRIRSDINDYLIDRGADGTRVIYWYHRQFIEVARERYLAGEQATKIHANLSEYFLGTWSQGKKKPYVNKKGESLEDDRLVSEMPLMFDNTEPNPVFNLRMLSELPYHLTCSNQQSILKERALFNFDFLVTKMRAASLDAVLDDFTAALAMFEDADLDVLEKTLRLSAVALTTDPRQLATQLIGRLLDFSKKHPEYDYIPSIIKQAYLSPVTCLIPSNRCLSAPGGSLITSFAIDEDHYNTCAFSCDNKTAYLASMTSEGLYFQVINLQTGKIQRKMMLTEPFEFVYTWSMKGSEKDKDKLLVMGSKYIFIIDAKTGKVLQQFNALEDETRYEPMPPVTFAEDENRVVAITNKNLKIWTSNDAVLQHTIDIGQINTDEQYGTIDAYGNIAVFCLHNSRTIKEVDVISGNIKREIQGFPGTGDDIFVKEVKLLSSEKVLALSSSLKSLSIYNLHNGRCLKDFQGFTINPGLHRLQITENGRKAVNIVMYEVMITDLESGEITRTLKSKTFGTLVIHTEFFTRNGRFAMSIGNDNILRLYDLKVAVEEDKEAAAKFPSNPALQAMQVASVDRVTGLYPGVDGRHVIANATVEMAAELSLWDVVRGTKVRAIKCGRTPPPIEIRMCSATRAVGYMHDVNFFHYRVFNIKEGKVERCLKGKASKRTPAFGRIDDTHVIGFSQGRRNLKVWDIDTGNVVHQYKFGQTHPLEEMLISKNGRMVVCAQVSQMAEHKDKTLPIIVVDTKTRQHKLLEVPQRQLTLTFSCISQDGSYLLCLTASHYKPRLWDLTSGKLLHKLEDKEYPVAYATAFSLPLQLALTAQSDGNINAWEIDSGKILHTFICETVDTILVSEDGNMAFCRYRYRLSNIDGWDLRNGTKLATFTSDWKPERVDIIGNILVLGMAENADVMTLKVHTPGRSDESSEQQSIFHGVPVEGVLEPCPDSPSADDNDDDQDDGEKTDYQKGEFTRKALNARPDVIIGGGNLVDSKNVFISEAVFKQNFCRE